MKIKRILVRGYGPLGELSLEPGDFDVVFGLNEAGKTALVEILAYVLFRKSVANLRYGKPDEILVQIEDDGRSISLPAKKSDIELPAGDMANLMYVQASESRLFGSRDEASFWDGMKSMLSKVGSGVTFTRLDTQIFDAVGLQPRKEEWKRDKQLVIENETRRRDALAGYIQKTGEIGKKEVKLAELERRGDVLKTKLRLIDQHKGFRDYQEIKRLYNAYQEAQTGCREYERYKYEYLNEWQRLDVERKTRSEQGIKLDDIRKERASLEEHLEELMGIDRYVESEGLRSAVSYMSDEPRVPSLIFPLVVVLVALVVTVLSLFTRLPLLPSVIFLAGAIFTLLLFIRRRNLAGRTESEKQNWMAKAKHVFPDIENASDLPGLIEQVQEKTIRTKTALQEKTKIIEQLTSARSIEMIEGEIADLRAKTGLAELHDLNKKLMEKRHLESELEKIGASLSQHLHENDPRKWERLVKEHQVKRPGGDIDLEAEKELRREQREVEQAIDGLTREIRLFRDVEQAKVSIADDQEAFKEYEMLEERLRGYELERKAALAAREILADMSKELDEFIGNILRGEEGLNEYFRMVTGRYAEVRVEKKNFHVLDKEGVQLNIDDLSSGTQDQLLLCFRMVALRKVYPKGAFLILDDAFIFADWQRRKRLAQLLKNFAGQGNQVIYLTSDDHTRDLFSGLGAKIRSLV